MIDLLSTILLFLILFAILVISHEFGHFLLGRLSGIAISEFTVGMGPKLLSFKKKGTLFSIRLLPFGGACIYDDDEEIFADRQGKRLSELKKEGLSNPSRKALSEEEKARGFLEENIGIPFSKAPVIRRIATVLAGPIFNFILAYILALIIVWFTGSSAPVINGLMEDFPAKEAGILPGDTIVSMNGSRIYLSSEIYLNAYTNKDSDMTIKLLRDGELKTVTVKPKYMEEEGRYLIGFNGYGQYVECKNFQVFKYAAYEVRYGIVGTLKTVLMLISGKGSKDDIGGPVAMATAIDEVKEVSMPYGFMALFINMINLAMLLSVNLGVVNLLPLPALDGGRLLFFIIELVRGKPISPEYEGIVHLVGIILLVGLMIFVTYNDIARLFL